MRRSQGIVGLDVGISVDVHPQRLHDFFSKTYVNHIVNVDEVANDSTLAADLTETKLLAKVMPILNLNVSNHLFAPAIVWTTLV